MAKSICALMATIGVLLLFKISSNVKQTRDMQEIEMLHHIACEKNDSALLQKADSLYISYTESIGK